MDGADDQIGRALDVVERGAPCGHVDARRDL